MSRRAVTIVDPGGNVIATADVDDDEGRFAGRVNLERMPAPLRLLFGEFEGIVNDQVFSLLDRIEGRINALTLSAVFADGRAAAVEDLQIFPGEGTISFRAVAPLAAPLG